MPHLAFARFVSFALGGVGDPMLGKILADELADDLRWCQILLRAQCFEGFLFVRVHQQSKAGGFRFHAPIVS